MADIQILVDELTLDPETRGYSGMSDAEAAADMNTVYRTRNRTTMAATEVYNAIDEDEWLALTDTERREVWDILHLGTLNPFGMEATRFTTIFTAGSDTIIALLAARTEDISRGVEIGWGHVKEGHIQMARL